MTAPPPESQQRSLLSCKMAVKFWLAAFQISVAWYAIEMQGIFLLLGGHSQLWISVPYRALYYRMIAILGICIPFGQAFWSNTFTLSTWFTVFKFSWLRTCHLTWSSKATFERTARRRAQLTGRNIAIYEQVQFTALHRSTAQCRNPASANKCGFSVHATQKALCSTEKSCLMALKI